MSYTDKPIDHQWGRERFEAKLTNTVDFNGRTYRTDGGPPMTDTPCSMSQSWRTTQNADDWASEWRRTHRHSAMPSSLLMAVLMFVSLVAGYLIGALA